MDFRDKHVVVTGGTGALGTAVVGALIASGAHCHVPYFVAAEAERFPHRVHAQVTLVVAGNLADGPRADLMAIRERLLQHLSPVVSAAGWRVYNQYLKANRVDEGTASYAEVVRLVLGVEFDHDWRPQRR